MAILRGFPPSNTISPTTHVYVCHDCGSGDYELKWRFPNGDLLGFVLPWDWPQNVINICNSCAKERQETVVTPCMKL